MAVTRCDWAMGDPLLIEYHDREWGVPVHDDRLLFEFLVLEGAQAGLSWLTILRKRDAYRQAFRNFDPRLVSRFGEPQITRLMANEGIVRNRRKIESAIANARVINAISREHGSFDRYAWAFIGGQPRRNAWKTLAQIPAATDESRALSKDLLKRRASFVGPTICYAFMQAVGMVNDHLVKCFRYEAIASGATRRKAVRNNERPPDNQRGAGSPMT